MLLRHYHVADNCFGKGKPKEEQELRLHLFQPVKGDLSAEVIETGQAYNKARRAYYKARQTYTKALNNSMPAIEELHKIECPDCPWDGKTIFPVR